MIHETQVTIDQTATEEIPAVDAKQWLKNIQEGYLVDIDSKECCH